MQPHTTLTLRRLRCRTSLLIPPEQLEQLEELAHRARLARQDQPAPLDLLARPDRLVPLVLRVAQGLLEALERPARSDRQVRRELLDRQAPSDPREAAVQRGLLDIQEPLEDLVPPEQPAPLAEPEQREPRERQAPPERLEPRAALVQQV